MTPSQKCENYALVDISHGAVDCNVLFVALPLTNRPITVIYLNLCELLKCAVYECSTSHCTKVMSSACPYRHVAELMYDDDNGRLRYELRYDI